MSGTNSDWVYPWPRDQIARYRAARVDEPLTIDGRLDEPAWQCAARSPRFRDLVSGGDAVHDTRAAVLWDDERLYVGYWIEEPFVNAQMTARDDLIYNENDVELFISGADAYYEFQVNARGTIYEALFVWEDAYERDGYDRLPGLGRDVDGYAPFDGVGWPQHPRGRRVGFFRWDMPGLEVATHVDGTLNDDTDRDRGWTVELAIPWASLDVLARGDDRALPPRPGAQWRIDFSRFNTYKAAPPTDGGPADSGGWALSPHGVWDSHIPELFTIVEFAAEPVDTLAAPQPAIPPR